jgi:hypoxanthine phosphoribosyltransferase
MKPGRIIMGGMTYSTGLQILISREAIAVSVKRLASEISHNYRSKRPVLLGILKGSLIFMSDLMRHLDFPLEVDFVTLSSYEGTESTGEVKLLQCPRINLANRHVLIIEDIIDTGITTEYYIKQLKKELPASIKLCALLDKPSKRKANVQIDYLGFSVTDKFIVGYGLDRNEEFRNLPDICYLENKN